MRGKGGATPFGDDCSRKAEPPVTENWGRKTGDGTFPNLSTNRNWRTARLSLVFCPSLLVSCALLLGPRLRRHKACEAVVHNELAVVFTAMFDEAVCYVENARCLITVYDSQHQAFLAL